MIGIKLSIIYYWFGVFFFEGYWFGFLSCKPWRDGIILVKIMYCLIIL